jgi:hypothetical protein
MIAALLPLEGFRVAVYTVHEPPEGRSGRLERAESLVFVKDGFSWAAALFAPIWLLLQRQWLAFLGYIVTAIAIGAGLAALDAEHWTGFALLGLHLLIGFEADSLRRRRLDRRGWRLVGTVTGPRLVDCERRFFEDWLPRQPLLEPGNGTLVNDLRPLETGPRGRRWRDAFRRRA